MDDRKLKVRHAGTLFFGLLTCIAVVVLFLIWDRRTETWGVERGDRRAEPAEPVEIPGRTRSVLAGALVAGPAPARGDVRIHGIVTVAVDRPVGGATVALLESGELEPSLELLRAEGRLAVTGADGVFTMLPAVEASNRKLRLCARHPDYVPGSVEVELRTGDNDLRIQLGEGLEIRGRVFCVPSMAPIGKCLVAARGIGASARSALPEVFPALRSRVQTTLTDKQGRFVIRGCQPGWYQVEAVAPGLASVGLPIAGGTVGTSTVIVRAGGPSVEFGMFLFYIGTIRIVDKSMGRPVATGYPNVTFARIPRQLERIIPIPLGLSNGVTFGAQRADPTGVFRYGFYAREVEDEPKAVILIPADVSVEGYEDVSIVLEARLVGSNSGPQDVQLENDEPIGLCNFILTSSDGGQPVGPTSLYVDCTTGTSGGVRVLRLKFDERGETGPVPLPVGPVVVRAPDAAEFAGGVEEQRGEIRREGIETVRLRIGWGGLLVTVVDGAGIALDDYGLRVGPGHGPVRMERKFLKGGTSRLTGLTYPGSGVGHFPVVVRFPVTTREGPITIEAFRHGYAVARRFANLEAGRVTRVEIALTADPEAKWLPKIEYPGGIGPKPK